MNNKEKIMDVLVKNGVYGGIVEMVSEDILEVLKDDND